MRSEDSDSIAGPPRQARLEDLAGFTGCVRSAYAADAARLPDLPDMTDGLEACIRRGEVWVLAEGTDIQAGVILKQGEGILQIVNLAVAEQCQGQGLGAALLGFARDRCLACGLGELRLTTHAAMTRTRAFYERHGWLTAGTEGAKVFLRRPAP